MRQLRAPTLLLTLVLPIVAAACAGGDAARLAGGGVRDTLPDGTPIVRYTELGGPDALVSLTPDLRIGSLEGDGADVFGDVRGIEADADGEIYVLDYQAAEVRVFSPTGDHLRTIARRGEGPGELGNSNGFVLAGDTLWVHDHSKMRMVGLSTEGGELARSDVPVRSYSYVWRGTRDHRGRFWKMTAHSDTRPSYPPEEGLQESRARAYMNVYDPASETRDSVYLGEQTYRSWVARSGADGYSMRGIPFESATVTEVDPSGGFWRVNTAGYVVARLDEAGDTLFLIDGGVAPRPVTDADREAFTTPLAEFSPDGARMAADVLEHAPTTLPVVKALVVDPHGRLWVERTVDAGARRLFDIFSPKGDYRGSTRLDFDASPYFPPRIRGDHLYMLETDELDVPTVVRAPLPSWAAAPDSGSPGGSAPSR